MTTIYKDTRTAEELARTWCRAVLWSTLLATISGCDEPAVSARTDVVPRWVGEFAVECSVHSARVSAKARDLPENVKVDAASLPGLSATATGWGGYSAEASIGELAVGTHRLTFSAALAGATASTSCEIERPSYAPEVNRANPKTEPFHRAFIAFRLSVPEGDPEEHRVTVGLDEDGNYRFGFRGVASRSVTFDGEPVELRHHDYFDIPVEANVGAKAEFAFENVDRKTAKYTVEITKIIPWGDEVRQLHESLDRPHEWAPVAPSPLPRGYPVKAVLLGESVGGDERGFLAATDGVRVLADVERVARVKRTPMVGGSCKYGPGGDVKLERRFEHAVIEVFDARSGELLQTSPVLKSKPPRCPSSASFETVLLGDDLHTRDSFVASDAGNAVKRWFFKHVGKRA